MDWSDLLVRASLFILGFGIFLYLGTTSCDPGDEAVLAGVDGVKGAAAHELLEEFLALGPRVAGTAGAERAADWLFERCRDLGWDAHIDSWRETTVAGRLTFHNVVARLGIEKYEDEFILLGSHFDTKYLPGVPDFQGANDSGSSTAVLLEIMRVLAENQRHLGMGVESVFFDGEECYEKYDEHDGLHGSRRHVERLREEGRLENCRAMILLDMVGDQDLRLTVPADSDPELKRILFGVAERLGVRGHVGYFERGTILDDHTPFAQAGVPVINLIDFEFGPDNGYWHTADDRIEHVSAESLEIVGRLTLGMIAELTGRK